MAASAQAAVNTLRGVRPFNPEVVEVKIYLVVMEGPEWTEVLGVFADAKTPPPGSMTAYTRAVVLAQQLEERNKAALQRVPWGYNNPTFLGLSQFKIEEKEAE